MSSFRFFQKALWAVFACIALSFLPGAAWAQSFGALARALPEGSQVSEDWRGRTTLSLSLTGGVPWRVFTLTNPDRLVLDFREVAFTALDLTGFDASQQVTQVAAGPVQAGWSRMVLELAEPLAVETAAMETIGPGAQLHVRLTEVDRAQFDANAGRPDHRDWTLDRAPPTPLPAMLPDTFTVVIDPGHGGIDPGAIRQGFEEADLVLRLALELEEALIRAGHMNVVLTRRDDSFVSLERRVAIAAQAGAHAFVSLHADALASGVAQGATVYTLSDTATDAASAALAERHNRVDLLAGLDLSRADDEVAQVLMDLARHDSVPRSQALAEGLVRGIQSQGTKMHRRPLQQAGFSVLKSAEIPSVLIEVGFLSTDADLERLLDPDWRARMVAGIRDGLITWAEADRAVAPLRRK